MSAPNYRFDISGPSPILYLQGDWNLLSVRSIERKFQPIGEVSSLTIDGEGLNSLDTAGAMVALSLVQSLGLTREQILLRGFSTDFQSISKLVYERLADLKSELREPRMSLIQDLGKAGIQFYERLRLLLDSLGEFVVECARLIARPSLFRPREFFVQLEMCCVYAIPIAALVTFLIGIVVAYLSAMQLERYGADIFLVDGVGITMCRELSPVLVAIIMAGRSGSAFTAQIGAMKINEEIDAIKILGLSPFHVLVLPRVLALAIALPLLTLVGDLVGIFGGVIIGQEYLGITFSTFLDRLQQVVAVKHVLIGLIKAPVFAIVIGLIGCRMGLEVESNATSVGKNTTSTVVQCIVAVILLDAAFALLFSNLRI